MSYRLLLRLLGHVLRVEAVCLLAPAAVSLASGGEDLPAFCWTILLTGVLGLLLSMVPSRGIRMQARDGFAIVALGWITMSAFGALPYVFSGAIPDYISALFETVSGFTTTGSTVLTDIESLPKGILFWRALTQWMGGVGVLVLTLAIFPATAEGSVYLMRAESPGPIKSKLVPRLKDTARILYTIYIGLTVGQTVCLRLAGVNWYEALTHAFTTISTGGFSVRAASVAAYDSLVVHWIFIIFQFLSGVNFSLLFLAVCRQFRAVWKSEELRFYTLLAVGSSALVTLSLVFQMDQGFTAKTVTDAAFQVVTVMTTTGYSTVDFDLWPTFARMILVLLMFTGACAGSTAGGIKSVRMVLLLKNIRREARRVLHPREVTVIKLDGHRVKEETLSSVTLFFFAYVTFVFLGALVVSWDDIGITGALSASLTCLGNVGPGLYPVGPTGSFAALSGLSKLVLTANMLLGRLEVLPLLVLLFPSMWKKR